MSISKGLNTTDITLLITLSIIVWVLGLVIGILTILFFSNKYCKPFSKPKVKEEVIIDIKQPPKTISKGEVEKKAFESLKLFISNFEEEIEKFSIENENMKYILENIHNYFGYCRKPNKAVIANILDEIDYLMIFVRNNRIEFYKIDYNKFENSLQKLKGEFEYFEYLSSAPSARRESNEINLYINNAANSINNIIEEREDSNHMHTNKEENLTILQSQMDLLKNDH